MPTYTYTYSICIYTPMYTFMYAYTSMHSYNVYSEQCRICTLDIVQQYVVNAWFSFSFFFSFSFLSPITQTKPSELAAEARRACWFTEEPVGWPEPYSSWAACCCRASGRVQLLHVQTCPMTASLSGHVLLDTATARRCLANNVLCLHSVWHLLHSCFANCGLD